MKTFSKLLSEVAQPKAEDEIHFKAKHEIEKLPHSHAGDETFKGSTKKMPKRRADYEKGNDEDVYEAMDPVGKEDDDIDNDGDVDSSDKYLHARRKAIGKAMKKKMKEEAELDEVLDTPQAMKSYKVKANRSKERASNSAIDKMLRSKDGPQSADISKETKTMDKRAKGLKMADRSVARKFRKEEAEELDELSNKTLTNYAKASYNDALKRRANRPAGKGDEADPKIGKRLAMNKLAHKKGAFKEEANMAEDAWEEIPMMSRQLQFIMYAAQEIMSYLNDCDDMCVDPEECLQNKLAHVHGQMMTLHGYVEGDRRMNMSMYGEEVELDEISKKTLVNYMDKSKKQTADIQKKFKKGTETRDDEKTFDRRVSGQIKALDKFHGRSKVPASGVDKAYDAAQKAMRKEEVELDEVTDQERLSARKVQRDAQTARHGIARKPGESIVAYLTRAKKHKEKMQKEEAELDEVTRSAIKRPVKYTDARGVTRTRMTTTRPVQHDEYGQEKIKESLQEAVKAGRLKLDDGSFITVSKKDAELLNQMFNDLNKSNRKKMQDTMMSDKAGYSEIVGFAREAL